VTLRLPIAGLVGLLALLGLVVACETGFENQLGGRDDDDSAWQDDDDSAGDDDDDDDDDDSSPTGDDDTDPPGDDDSSPSGNFEGDQPGECSDGADNDQDGLFDCDDPDCFGAPECGGDDDASPGDDDDTTAGPGAPEITLVTYEWIPAEMEFEFDISIQDPPFGSTDCDLYPVTLHWTLNGDGPTAADPLGDPNPLICAADYRFWLRIVNAGLGMTYTVTFAVEDSSGNLSADYTVQAQVLN
jgi:hypothetical protein